MRRVTVSFAVAACWVLCSLAPAGAEDSLPQNGKIAFDSRDGKIYTVEPDGSNVRLLSPSSSYPNWSPDGTEIVVAEPDGTSVSVVSADGRNVGTFHRIGGFTYEPTWFPDGTKLAFVGDDIFMMDQDGSNKINLTKTPRPGEHSPAFSPKGSQICFSRERYGYYGKSAIFVMDTDASNPTQVTNANSGECAWSPDGKKIAYTYEQPKQRGATLQDSDVYVMNADGSEKTNLTSNRNRDAKPNRNRDADPEWSPDGKKITFASNRDGDSDIYTMDADGSDVTQVTNLPGDEEHPDWQPLPGTTVNQPDTGGPSLLLVASALLFFGGVMFYAGLKRSL